MAIDRRIVAGLAALLFAGFLIGGSFAGLASRAVAGWSSALSAFDPYLFRVARFSVYQAILSTVLSVGLAIPVTHALSRHPAFPGRELILRLFAVPLALPPLVAALGILALYGNAGFIRMVPGFGENSGWSGIYGLSGILIAHVFFNLPLSVRLMLGSLSAVPDSQWRLAAQLGMGGWPVFRLIEWPAIRSSLPGIAGLVFMLCITSFAIVLILGGGPRATTLEVAIYQALRFDFDLARAITLAIVQIILTVLAVTFLWRTGAPDYNGTGIIHSGRRYQKPAGIEAVSNTVLILASLIFVAGPLISVVVSGLGSEFVRLVADPAVQRAVLTSLVFGFLSAALAVILSLSLVGARWQASRSRSRTLNHLSGLFDAGASLVLVIPPIVIGAGWFILSGSASRIELMAPVLVITVNAAMAMPFAVRAIRPAHDAAASRHDRLCAQLSITGFDRLRLIDWPVLKPSIAIAMVFAMALSLGDLGVIALFGSDQVQTLPHLILARMASYRTADAAGLALILGLVCFLLMFFAGRPLRS